STPSLHSFPTRRSSDLAHVPPTHFRRAYTRSRPLVRPLIIGVAGGSGSGKTTVARRVAEALDGAKVAFLDMDAYYRDHHALSHRSEEHTSELQSRENLV